MNGELGRCLLNDRLKERGWNHQDLAGETGIDFRQISFWANDERAMSLKNAIIVSNALGCTVQSLYKNGPLL
ncbi:helix-turn-helix transcriptional regulator [Paenibacillus sp. FSL R5-0908]|uniref:helix-turn-helix transcriptional regulator n=1 Tax=Paenibacillus sp. FSL R5-0908 TaxID=2921664 RepID=UPI0030F787D7